MRVIANTSTDIAHSRKATDSSRLRMKGIIGRVSAATFPSLACEGGGCRRMLGSVGVRQLRAPLLPPPASGGRESLVRGGSASPRHGRGAQVEPAHRVGLDVLHLLAV